LSPSRDGLSSALQNIVVVEVGDERCEFAGLLLNSLGAQVIKLEPREGSPSRRLGPFTGPTPDPEHSLCFWRYNLGKKSVTLDIDHQSAQKVIDKLAMRADVIIDSGEGKAVNHRLGLYRKLREKNQSLLVCLTTPYGLDGPYCDFKASDLTQLAMGGVMAVCGYDPRPDGTYDTPPIAPGMWHSYHLASEYAVVSIMAALNFRELTGEGQLIDVSIHEAVNTCTEVAMPTYIYAGMVVKRQTSRHAAHVLTRPWLHRSADGSYVNATVTPFEREFRALVSLLDEAGIEHDLRSDAYADQKKRSSSRAQAHINELIDKLIGSMPAEVAFHKAQAKGIGWAYVRRPEENLEDRHFQARGSFAPIHQPETGRDLYYPASVATDGKERVMGPKGRAPHLGEHTREVLLSLGFSASEIADLAAQGVFH
jgi:crotonobetainyl-CoA:carnitine CoA-transferase CaiB-like acyl-CoA transferase